MLRVRVQNDAIRIGRHFSVSFQRTLRIPDDGRVYPLPPGLGRFPVCRVRDYARRVPAAWREHGGVFIPMYQREALWLAFEGAYWRPTAVKVAVGKVNAISGDPWSEEIGDSERPQDYVVAPTQPWLDGINAGAGFIRQFVAMPLGMGYTVEGQSTGKEEFGGVQIVAYDPKPGRFPDRPPHHARMGRVFESGLCLCEGSPAPFAAQMGLAAGGRMHQDIYPDEHGADTWDAPNRGRVYVHIVNSDAFRDITGMAPPPSPVSAHTYTQYGLPWFDLYGEGRGDLAPSPTLAGVKSVKQKDQSLGFAPQQNDAPLEVPVEQVVSLGAGDDVNDGAW